METKIIENFLKKFRDDRFSLAYLGEFNDNMTAALMRSNETSIMESKNIKKKLSYLVAECFQNIIRHADRPALLNQTTNKPNIFILRNRGDVHYISSTNLIENKRKDDLHMKLRSINVLTAEDLKDVYLGALVNNEISAKGGGGLGLIEMARKSGYPLQYAFEIVNYFLSTFYFQVSYMSKEARANSGNQIPVKDKIEIDETKDIYNKMIEENVILIRVGDFSQGSILPIIELLETSLNAAPGSKKKTMYLLVEMLQNISKHGALVGDERKGLFLISHKNNSYILTAGNYVANADVEKLKNKLASVVNLDNSGLNWAYRNALSREDSENKGAGIGLIEMCKYSKEPVRYAFIPGNNDFSFFTLSVTI